MIKKEPFVVVSLAALLFCVVIASASAQDTAPPKTAAPPQAQTPAHSYRLDYTLTELENGKKIDARQYSISVGGATEKAGPASGQVQIGTKVPVGVNSDGGNQYVDVGTKIDCLVRMRDGATALDTDLQLSNVVRDEGKVNGLPILRTLRIRNQTPVVIGKSVIVGTLDDPDSNRTFQLEVTATEIK